MEIVRFAVVALFKMKYITLIIGLLVVGCGTPTENTTKAKPVKELTPKEKQKAPATEFLLPGLLGEKE
jgi:hypothetical protein